MVNQLIRDAHSLDAWLHEHFRLYTFILGCGLVIAIFNNVGALGRTLSGTGAEHGDHSLKLLVMLVFQAALLVNQVAQLHEHRQRRRNRKAAEPDKAK